MKRSVFLLLLIVFSIPFPTFSQQGLDTLNLKSIFHEPLLAGNRPNFVSFSPDLDEIYYQTNDSSMIEEEMFIVGLNGKDARPAPEEFERGFTVSPNNKYLAYVDDADDIWLADPDFKNKRRIIESGKKESDPVWSPQGNRLAFVQDGDVWIINIGGSRLTQVTAKKSDEPDYEIIEWAGTDKIVLSQSDRSNFREFYFPEYVHKYVQAGADRRGVAKEMISVAYLDSNKVNLIHEAKEYISSSISASGSYLAMDRIDPAMKHRIISIFDINKAATSPTTVFEDSTGGWIYNREMDFAPEGESLMFLSEKDGWNHIYTVHPDGSDLEKHTNGSHEISWAEWVDERTVVFASNEVDPGERHLYMLNTNNSRTEKITSETGFRQDFELSRNKRYLIYEYTYFNTPFELYALDLKRPRKEVRLTHTIPERFYSINWQQEDYIRFTGRDGETELSMSVLEPLDKQSGQKYPVVVFVHGAGSLQNVYKGWSNSYYREYMFHQYLNEQGYYVIEVDYRHSTGYGRKFREDVTNWMGKYETQDIIDGINYLAKNYTSADTGRVGIYGGSYGGFMALYAASVSPQYFDAAAALRAVTNWENYYYTNPWYTWPRLGTPEKDSTHYARSSPITYVDQLERPVLILHGLEDDNVRFQDAAQYIDELIQADGKEFDMMMYPDERHSFEDPDAWFDEYSRIYEFFERHLK